MATITVRNVEDRVVDFLKERAKANHRSLEGEIRHLLERHLLENEIMIESRQLADFRERARRLRALSKDRPQTDSALLIREDRDR